MIAPLAAAAALALVAVPTLMRRGTQTAPARAYATALAADPRFAAGLRAGWDQRWEVTRGAESSVVVPGTRPIAGPQENRLAFRLGVRSVDLQIALSRGDTGLAAVLTGEIGKTLGGIALSDFVVASYDSLETHLATDSRAESIDRASGAEGELRTLLGPSLSASYSFGQWSGAAELAAQTRDASFFQSNQGKAFLRSADAASVAGEDAEALRAIDAHVKQGLSDQGLDEMHEILQSMIRRRGG